MDNNLPVVERINELARRANQLRDLAKQKLQSDHEEVLWMSGLDIIGELLNVVQSLADERQTHAGGLAAHHSGEFLYSGLNNQQGFAEMLMQCPSCHSKVDVSYEAVADAAAKCPVCGESVLLTNPT